MSFKIGDQAVHVEHLARGRMREILRVTIARETATLWIDSMGDRWRKKGGARVPQYCAGPRYLVTVEAFETNQRENAA